MPPTGIGVTDVASLPGLKELWTQTLGDPRICIAVLDGPVDISHPCLAGANLTRLETLVCGTADTGPASQHGTHIASVVFAQHALPDARALPAPERASLKGIAPRCRGLIVPVFKDGPGGSLAPCTQIDLARAITQAVQGGAHVINVSGGEFSPSSTAHPILADAVRDAVRSGVLIIAAAGNQGCDCLHVPGALPSVLAVGAMDAKGEPLEFSNWGQIYQTQGILAPGENILGALPGGGSVTQTGTSYATPMVSAVAGLLLSLQLKLSQKPDPQAVRKIMLDSALGCEYQQAADCRRVLAGRLNISGAVLLVTRGASIMTEQSEIPDGASSPALSGAEIYPSTGPASVSAATVASEGRSATVAAAPPQSPSTRAGPAFQNREPLAAASAEPSRVRAAACGCGCAAAPAQLVFALGQLGFDYGTEARRDSIAQHMPQPANPHDPRQLLAYLDTNPSDAASIIWTLNLDATPIYGIHPHGAFASQSYDRLREFLRQELPPPDGEGVERISVPGHVAESVRLFTGQVVPLIHPELRGMYSWTTRALVEAVCGKSPAADATQQKKDAYRQGCEAVENFLRRVYDDLRNLGLTPQERAINFSATNALLVEGVFRDAIKEQMDLDTIEAERSPICRPDSDCWDVKLTFFDPKKVFERARKVYRFTVDVSDVVPVMVGPVRSWFVR